jgi:ferredoxin-like protein FixX
MKCSHCNDTGSLSKDLDGFLDCTHCDVATERAKLEAWAFELMAKHGATGAMWLVFQHGKAATAAGATN